jgi:hypothetical protein
LISENGNGSNYYNRPACFVKRVWNRFQNSYL